MAESTSSNNVTFRCPQALIDSIEAQSKETGKNKSNVIVTNLLSAIFSVSLSERANLPKQPAIYFVFTIDKKLLYVGCAENLYLAWTNHPNYQQFNEACSQTRIGYFTFQSFSEAQNTFTTIDKTPETLPNTNLTLELEQLKKEIEALKQNQTNSSIFKEVRQIKTDLKDLYIFMGKLNLKKTLEDYSSLLFLPGVVISFESTDQERKNGLTHGELISRLGFYTSEHFKTIANFHKMDEKLYLSQISLWLEDIKQEKDKQGKVVSRIVRWRPSAEYLKYNPLTPTEETTPPQTNQN